MTTNKLYRSLFIIFFLLIALFLTTTSLFAQSITISWVPPATNADASKSKLTDLAGFTIYYGTSSNNYSNSKYVGNVSSYQIDALAAGFTYYFSITALDKSNNESALSTEVSVHIPLADSTPPVISGVYSDQITSSSASVNWITDELSDSQVKYGVDLSFGDSTVADTFNLSVHNQIISNLLPFTTYYYQVQSTDPEGNKSTSLTYSFTTLPLEDTTPPVISNINISNILYDLVTITWATDEKSTSQIEFGRDLSYGNFTPYDSSLKTVHSVTLTNLTSHTEYLFRIISDDSSGNEGMSEFSKFTTSNFPPAISSFYTKDDLTGYGPLRIKFKVKASDDDGDISSYKWDFDGDGIFDKTTSKNKVKHTYRIAGSFKPRVKVIDDGGASVMSEPLTVTILSEIMEQPIVKSLNCKSQTIGNNPLTVVCRPTVSGRKEKIIEYHWDFEGNGQFNITTDSTPISYTYNDEGTYNTKLKILSEDGAVSTEEAIITVSASSNEVSSAAQPGGDSNGGDGGGGCFISNITSRTPGYSDTYKTNEPSILLFMIWIGLIGTAYFITIKN